MAKFEIAIADTQEWAFQGLRSLLPARDFELWRIKESDLLSPERATAAQLVVLAAERGDPWRAVHLAQRLAENHPAVSVILLAWASSEELAIAALRARVTDYFTPPIRLDELARKIQRVAHACLPPTTWMRRAEEQEGQCLPIIGNSRAITEVRAYLERVAQRDCNTMLLGETGTGKELVAQAIHSRSPRRNRPFVCINCAAIPDTLLESELFGYERGAFTGANVRTTGKIEQAHGGTVFFDEIGEMTPYAQAKILRVIEDRQIQRLGGRGNVSVNVRILSATNQDLPKLIFQHRFRKDLYFRLNVACIRVPALRERREDIPDLLLHYVRIFNRQTGCAVEDFAPDALEHLQNYEWPGNVRELKNLVESIFVDPPPRSITLEQVTLASNDFSGRTRKVSEREQLVEALTAAQGNKSKAAESLHWSRMTIYRKIAKYKIDSADDYFNAVGAS